MFSGGRAVTDEPKKKKVLSRWGKNTPRYDSKRTVDHTRFVKGPDGARRRETDAPTEAKFCERSHEQSGWRNGARIRKA
jgi:hypothetical protein